MTGEELGALLTGFTDSVYRLETRQHYDVPAEADRIGAFNAGQPLVPRPASSNAIVREAVAAGKRVERVHVVELPLTQYLRYELAAYEAENIPAGEEVYLVDRAVHSDLEAMREDYLLCDAATDHAALVWVLYDGSGRHLGWRREHDPRQIAAAMEQRQLALQHAEPFAVWMERHNERVYQ